MLNGVRVAKYFEELDIWQEARNLTNKAQLYVALDRYINKEEFYELFKSAKRLSIMISNLITHIRRSGLRGEKFRPVKQKSIKEELEEVVRDLGIDISKNSSSGSK